MRLSLGPILYYWDREAVLDFYARVADAPVDIVYLGEVVCAKRRALRGEDWLRIAEELESAGAISSMHFDMWLILRNEDQFFQ